MNDTLGSDEEEEEEEENEGRGDQPPTQQDINAYLTADSGVVNVDQGDVGVVCDAAIATNGMGPCIAVGKTGTFDGHRFSALTHWDGTVPGAAEDLVGVLDDDIRDKMNAVTGRTGTLTDERYLVVGGRPESAENQHEIREVISSLDVSATFFLVTQANTTFAAQAESAAMISETGEFSYQVVQEGQ
ncbi:hypothetical protein [Actinophytocola oryzae]|uniref:Uncharacterized protein n=1 Tax=Actinophytocola oryzae TaxID=502181 RepID=A0A4R7W4Z5_9PSEU|nr:hypothetical protein [Actinophytocola oryzae]TDV57622.1 hypothetical protein CLV71_101495 [Actinophytocola oryzae]